MVLRSFAARILPAGSTREKPSKPLSSSSASSAFASASTADAPSPAAVARRSGERAHLDRGIGDGRSRDQNLRQPALGIDPDPEGLLVRIEQRLELALQVSRNESRMTRYPKTPATPITAAIPSGTAQYSGVGPRYA